MTIRYRLHSLIGGLLCAVFCLVTMARGENVAADVEFDALSKQVAAAPEDVLLGNRLRTVCRRQKISERCIDFFDKLSNTYPSSLSAKFNASLAYVDNLPGHSLVTQARLSTRSMEHMSVVLNQDANNWLALYIRGLNNVYWPSWFRRIGQAIADLEQCIRYLEATPREQWEAYFVLPYVALGDAFVKADRIEDARQTWMRGLDIYPSTQLRARLGLEGDVLRQFVEAARSRDVPIDTDLLMFTSGVDKSRL